MRRFIPIIIIGGVLLVVGAIVAPLIGTYFYMRSPQKAVEGAFQKLIAAKTFKFSLEAAEDRKNGVSYEVSGSLDKKTVTQPAGDLVFSFNVPDIKFSGEGKARAHEGIVYLQFEKVSGMPDVAPTAFGDIWSGVGVDALLAFAKDLTLPEAAGNLTEDDLQEILSIAKKHLPFAVVRKGAPTFMDNVLVNPYDIVLDRAALNALFTEIKTEVKGSLLDKKEKDAIDGFVSSVPSMVGQVWVSQSDGTLRGMLLIAKNGDYSFHMNLRFSDYDKTVPVAAIPQNAKPLFELIRRLFSTSLAGVKPRLPFDLPVPIYNINMGLPEVSLPAGGNQQNVKPGALPNLIRIFYGTDKPFSAEIGK